MADVSGLIRTLDDLAAALADRRRALQLSQAEVEHRAGFHANYLSHLEQPARPHGRNLGSMSLPTLLDVLGCRLVLVPVDDTVTIPRRAA